LSKTTPGILNDFLFGVHEGALNLKEALPGDLVLYTNLRLGHLCAYKQTLAPYSGWLIARAMNNLVLDPTWNLG